MVDNIQIVNPSGIESTVEGITYIELTEKNKKYLVYTLNEKVDNDLTKVYVAETNTVAEGINPINDADWEDLRTKMIRLSHKEDVEGVNYLSMKDIKFYVSDPKKLAITTVAKQSFKDVQAAKTMTNNNDNTAVTTGSPAFFNEAVVGMNEQAKVEVPQEESIFANPPQPVNVEPSAVAPAEVQVAQEVTPVQPVAPVSQPVAEAPVSQPVAEVAVQKPKISDEEALNAINIIQDYLDQENGNQ